MCSKKCENFFVDAINPSFRDDYSNPLLMAITVGIFTVLAILGIGTFNFLSSSDTKNFPMQYVGTSTEHAGFVKHMLKMSYGDLRRGLCITDMYALVVKGTQVVNEPCVPTDSMINDRLIHEVEAEWDKGERMNRFEGYCGTGETVTQCQPDLTYVITYDLVVNTRISHPLIAIGAAAGLSSYIMFVFTHVFRFIYTRMGCVTYTKVHPDK